MRNGQRRGQVVILDQCPAEVLTVRVTILVKGAGWMDRGRAWEARAGHLVMRKWKWERGRGGEVEARKENKEQFFILR